MAKKCANPKCKELVDNHHEWCSIDCWKQAQKQHPLKK